MDVKEIIRKTIKAVIPAKVKQWIVTDELKFGQLIYSQEGEDKLMYRLVNGKPLGIYVDVGAHHPKKFSNTYFFYKMGWRGINIDAMPGSMDIFNIVRPDDINIEAAISDTNETLEYHIFSHPELNSFSSEVVQKFLQWPSVKLIETKEIQCKTLAEILNEHLGRITPRNEIDFLSVDVEGLDVKVMRSNDWNKFKPRFIIGEDLGHGIFGSTKGELTYFLESVGYSIIAKTYNSVFYKRDDFTLDF